MSRAQPRFKRVNPPLPLATANVWQVSVIGSIENQSTINTFYYWDNAAALISTSEQNISNGWQTALLGPYRACISADWGMQAIKVQCLTSQQRVPLLDTSVVGNAGTAPAGHAPTEVAAIMQRKTNFKGQSGRGRIMLPAVSLTHITGSALNAAGVTAF